MKSFAHHYSSDISREQFELIRTDLEGIRKRTKPRKVDLYSLYIVHHSSCSKCQEYRSC